MLQRIDSELPIWFNIHLLIPGIPQPLNTKKQPWNTRRNRVANAKPASHRRDLRIPSNNFPTGGIAAPQLF